VHNYVHNMNTKMKINDIGDFISATKARNNFFTLLDKVKRQPSPINITVKGIPKAVIMSKDEFESWQETLEVMAECPDLKKDIEETKEALKTSEYKNWSTLEDLLAKEGFVVAEKPSQKYDVSTKAKTKRRKKPKKNS